MNSVCPLWNGDAVEHEAHDADAVLGIANEREAWNLSELLTGILGEFVLMI